MESLFLKTAQECIKDFKILYNTNTFISIQLFEEYLDTYKEVFELFKKYLKEEDKEYKQLLDIVLHGYEKIDLHNQVFIQEKLKEEKEYFDHMFDKIDPSICLDEEQRKAILIDEDYSLIVAGAGSGKTTTMAAKVKYLIEKKNISPNEIIVLAFTNKAAEELQDRINNDFHLNVEVMTFHKLGMRFLRNIFPFPIQIIGTGTIYQTLSTYIKEIVFKDKNKLSQYMDVFDKYIHFDDLVYRYNNYSDYYKEYTNQKYELCKKQLKKENQYSIKTRMKYLKTIDGKYVRSEGEVEIANYLYTNSIPYEYEKLYPYHVKDFRSYSPDFTIFNGDLPIYLEFYGMAMNQNGIITSNIENYKNNILKKRDVHTKNNTNYIELFGKYNHDSSYLLKLSIALDKYKIPKTQKTEKEIFYKLMETSDNAQFLSFIKLMSSFISKFKEANLEEKDFDRLYNIVEDKKIKKQLLLTKEVYQFYNKTIHQKRQVDFQDMINYSYQLMKKTKEKKAYLKYQYIMIDEYQDISKQRYNFTKRISDLFHAKIIAVGDDWQAIYSFSGSDVKLFTNFCNLMGYGETIKIKNTYRNSQELINLASEFVYQDKNLIPKTLHSNKHIEKPVVLKYYDTEKNNIAEKLEDILLEIYKENQSYKVLLLGRYNFDLDDILDSNIFNKEANNRIYCKSAPNLFIDFLTVHGAKGLGYDEVILINAIDDIYGFPSQMKDEPLLQTLNPISDDEFDYSEERRLFYVALTRTKNRIFILCPRNNNQLSEFIKEIKEHESVKI